MADTYSIDHINPSSPLPPILDADGDKRVVLEHRNCNCECEECWRRIYKLPPAKTADEKIAKIKVEKAGREVKKAISIAKREVRLGKQATITKFFRGVSSCGKIIREETKRKAALVGNMSGHTKNKNRFKDNKKPIITKRTVEMDKIEEDVQHSTCQSLFRNHLRGSTRFGIEYAATDDIALQLVTPTASAIPNNTLHDFTEDFDDDSDDEDLFPQAF